MAYEKQTWSDYPSGGTPISAARLNHIEDGLYAAALAADGGDTTGGNSAITIAQNAQNTAQTALNKANQVSVTLDAVRTIFVGPNNFTVANGWSVNRASWIKIGRLVACDVSLTRTGTAIASGASGNIANTLLGTVTNDFKLPSQLQYQGIPTGPGGAVATYFIQGNSIFLAAYSPNSTINTGTEITFAGTYMGDSVA